MLWGIVIFSDGGFDWLVLSVVLLVCCVISLMAPVAKKHHTAKSADGLIRVRKFGDLSIDQVFATLEQKLTFLAVLRKRNESMIISLIPWTGRVHDAEKISTNITRASVSVFIPLVIAGIYLGWTIHPAFLALCAVPIVIYAAPWPYMKLVIGERKSRIEEEMAYFLCYVNIMQIIGKGLYDSFDSLRGTGIFHGMERDAGEIVKRVIMTGMTQNDSLTKYAESHPSEPLRVFIQGYLAKITSLGNVPTYTAEKAAQFFELYKSTWERYEKSSQEMFAGVLIMAIIMPLMIMIAGMIATASTISVLLILGSAISPVVSAMMLIMLDMNQPVTGSKVRMKPYGIPIGVVVAFIAWMSGLDMATVLAAGCMVAAAASAALVRDSLKAVQSTDLMLPEFCRDVTEMSKAGSNMNQIVTQQAEKRAYTPHFNRVLENLAGRINMGKPFHEAVSDMRFKSLHMRFIMFLFARTYTTGGGNADIFNDITVFVRSIHEVKQKVVKSLRPMSMIVYATPFIMLGIAHVMVTMLGSTGSFGGADSGLIGGANIPFVSSMQAIDEQYLTDIQVLVALTAIPMGFVAAKISTYTVRNLVPVAIVSGMTILAIHILPPVLGLFMGGL